MSEPTCGVCNSAPKKYKCPTCALPYCSIACFREHKTAHADGASKAPTPPPAPDIPIPSAPPEHIPKYLRARTDFSPLATDAQFQELLRSQPTLLPTLQRIYAATLEPDEPPVTSTRGRGGDRGHWRGGRGRGRGRGRGGRGGWGGGDERPKWTAKKGDKDAMRLLKGLREGRRGEAEKESIGEFVRLVDERFGAGKRSQEESEAMATL